VESWRAYYEGKTMKMTKPKETKKPKGMPLAIMIAIGKPKMALPKRGQRTATNMMKKSSRGK
jgi:hypothetical protein